MNNPIRFIDPDGMNVDWYEHQNENGSTSVIWQEGSAPEVTIQGETYTNAGTSASVGTGDGTYVNYYQNVPISTSNEPVNAQETVLNNVGLTGQLLGKDSPLSEMSQTGLMTSIIHQGQNEFLSGTISLAGNVLDKFGTGATLAGYGAAFIPGAQPIATCLIGAGKGMSIVGGTINAGIDLKDGSYGKAAVTFGSMMIGSGFGRKIENAAKLSQTDKLILKTGVDLKMTLLEKTINTSIDKKKQ
jgi:hypothetical protein